MDWSKAKSLLIIAFLAVNIFLASQLIKAKGEQTQNQEVSQVTQLQLEELIADRNIRIPDNLPQKAFPVTYLEAEPTKPESLLEQSDPSGNLSRKGGTVFGFNRRWQREKSWRASLNAMFRTFRHTENGADPTRMKRCIINISITDPSLMIV